MHGYNIFQCIVYIFMARSDECTQISTFMMTVTAKNGSRTSIVISN